MESEIIGGDNSNAVIADVTFILDISTSMNAQDVTKEDGQTGKYYRVEAMVKATNEAIDIIMKANPQNRVAVHWFGGAVSSTHVGTLMEMGSYTTAENTDYIDYTRSGRTHTIKTNNNLKKDGKAIATKSENLKGGTPTQHAIMYGVSKAINDISETNDENERKPYVFLLSDGAAIQGGTNWSKLPNNPITPSQYSNFETNLGEVSTAFSKTGSKEITAVTILTGNYMRDKLEEAYREYNNEEDTVAQFYTVGLGAEVDIYGPYQGSQSVYAWAGLDPAEVYSIKGEQGYRGGVASEVHNQIQIYAGTEGERYKNNYIYTDHYTFAENYDVLSEAFQELARDVESATTILPILNTPQDINSEIYDIFEFGSAIVISDEIGEGFKVDRTTLKISGKTATEDEDYKNQVENGTVYKFSGLESRVVVKENNTLTWYIDADDMKSHVYRFENRVNPEPGKYKKPENGPFKLNYKIVPNFEETPDELETYSYLTNAVNDNGEAKTVAYFIAPKNNPFYKELGENNEAKVNLVEKTDGLGASYISKEMVIGEIEGIDGSGGYYKVATYLGNNGQLNVEMGVVKTGPEKAKVGKEIEYKVTIYNYTDEDKEVTVTSEGKIRTVTVPNKNNNDGKVELIFTTTVPNNQPTSQPLESGKAIVTIADKTIQSNKVTTLVEDVIEYTVTYNKNGGDTEADPQTQIVEENMTVGTFPTPPTKEGYEFKGWYYKDGEEEKPFTEDTEVTSDIEVYAKWKKIHKVTFKADEEAEEGTELEVENGETVGDNLPSDPTKEGYEFKGWYYKDGEEEKSFTEETEVTSDIEVYAKWTEMSNITINYTINDSKYGDISNNSESLNPKTGISKGSKATAKEGYHFVEWQDSKGSKVSDKAEFTPGKQGGKYVAETYTAIFEPNQYKVTFLNYDESVLETHTVEYGKVTVPDKPVREGYTFKGWNTKQDGNGKTFDKNTPVKDNITVYAQWKEIEKGTIETETDKGKPATGYTPSKNKDELTYRIAEPGNGPNNGDAEVDRDTGSWTYTPDDGFTGKDEFTIEVTDEDGNIVEEIPVKVLVKDPDSDAVETEKGKPVDGSVTPSEDPDKGKTIYEVEKQPGNGTATVDKDGNWIYTPNKDFVGKDEFTIKITYPNGDEEKVTVKVTVNQEEVEITMVALPKTIVLNGEDESELIATVKDVQGNPVAGVEVEFNTEMGTFPNGNKTTTAVTDENGEAKARLKSEKIKGTETYEVSVTATVDDKAKGIKGKTEITMFFEPVSVSGVVKDKDGKPIKGAKVLIKDGDFEKEVTTDSEGKYKIYVPESKPEDEWYEVEITKTIKIGDKEKDITFKQKANPGLTKGDQEEDFPAEKTFTGVIITKDENGKDTNAGKIGGNSISIKPLTTGVNADSITLDTDNGVFSIEGLTEGIEYEFAIVTKVNGKELVVGKMTVELTEDGEVKIHEQLIDPYGTIRDAKTNKVLGDVNVQLYYANTERNRNNGRTPGTLVNLPKVEGFAPGDNANPQISTSTLVVIDYPDENIDDHGNYAWLVFPETDYYIVATKSGYEKYTGDTISEIISVEWDVVKHDFAMTPIDLEDDGKDNDPDYQPSKPEYTVRFVDHDGTRLKTEYVEYGKSARAPRVSEREGYKFVGWDKKFDRVTGNLVVTALYEKVKEEEKPTKPIEEDRPVDGSTDLTSNQRTYLEGTEAELEVKYTVKEGKAKEIQLVVTIPDGAQVINPDGGRVVENKIIWDITNYKSGEIKTLRPLIKLPQISTSEEEINLTAQIVADGKVIGTITGISALNVNLVSNRHGNQHHTRYIQGYPDGEFKPDRTITRAEIAVAFARILKLEDLVENEQVYEDVKLDTWYAKGVEAATKRGLIKGYGDGSFKPDQPITKAELATVVARFLELPDRPPVNAQLTDIDKHWAFNYIAQLYRNNVVEGYQDGTFKPDEPIKRSEAVTMINKMLYRGPLRGIQATFPDVDLNHWANGHVEESTRSHEYIRNTDGSETHILTTYEELNF